MNYVPQSRMTSWGNGYQESQVHSAMLATTSTDFVLGACFVSNQSVAGSIIVTHHNLKVDFSFLRASQQGVIMSAHNFSHRGLSASFSGSLPCFFFVLFVS
jgi:hypothetical protein